ncbi:MAG: prepilin-type N-terminal cleavage/methylation domain-containing protein [Planctomycetota bacterium]|jgi:prepilin-type N-terminal cleavage/methylation domain-containing protein/prepilin-type processing-associated H-X9-DG protein
MNFFRLQKKAFTLIELLVVISVVSLLMAILMPALATARRKGREISCLSNLRQMAIAAHSYAYDFDGFYPIAYLRDPDPYDMLALQIEWDFIQIKDWTTMEQTVKPGILWQDTEIGKIHQCSSFKGQPNSNVPYFGYNYNTSYIGHGANEAIPKPVRVADVKKPYECALFGDGEYYDGANKFMRSPYKCKFDLFPFRSSGTQGYRHSGKTNVVWCDGHAGSQKEYYTDTSWGKEEIDIYNKTAKVKVGFLSVDNSAYDLE